jgi:hypothetical protein
MKIFDEAPVECPPVRVTPLDDDDAGHELLSRLHQLQQQLADANHRAAASSRPLPGLIARADELAAQSMAGQADPDDAASAEEAVREAQSEVEAARREARQCTQAITLVEEKLDERARKLYAENAENVRTTHRALAEATLKAQERASTLLRILREFEMRYARYTESTEPEPYPRYLRDEERTRPSRSIMGPAQSPSGHVYASGEATSWMQRAAQLLDVDGPAVIEVDTLNFESESATIRLADYSALDATPAPAHQRRNKPASSPERAQEETPHPTSDEQKTPDDIVEDSHHAGTESSGDAPDETSDPRETDDHSDASQANPTEDAPAEPTEAADPGPEANDHR